MNKKSISFQNGQGDEKHNRREEKVTGKQEHINKKRSDLNIKYIDENIEDVYQDLFGESCKEYNARARKERKIENYYEKIQNDSKKKVSYECIVQVGKKSDTGSSSELEKKALDMFMQEWKTRNPNLFVYCAYMHNDEGTSHLHIDYIPVAKDCKRGMKVQNSLTQALQQQGFKATAITNTEQMQWQNSERKALEKICQELGIDAKANQGLCKTKYFDAKTGQLKVGTRKHLSVEEYKQARQEMLSDVQQEKAELKQENSELQQEQAELQEKKATAEEMLSDLEQQKAQLQLLKQEKEQLTGNIAKSKARIDKLNKDIIRKTDVLNIQKAEIPEIPETVVVKNVFGKEKTRPLNEEERKLKQQEIDNIRKQNELVELQNLLRERELTIQEQERKQKARLQKQNAELEQINNEIETAKATKTNLQREIDDLQHEKAEIVANAVNNALENLDELKIYYEQQQIFRKIYQKHYAISENQPRESEEKYENKNVKNSYDFGV